MTTKTVKLEKLDQSVIDKHGLILFNIRALYRHNKILIIMIDEEGTRYEHTTDFKSNFWIHHDTLIMNNDYIYEKKDLKGVKWVEYDCYDINVYKQLKMMLAKSMRGDL